MISIKNKQRFIKFFKKRSIIDPDTNCWLYKLRLQAGYARVNYENQHGLLHRFSMNVFTDFDLDSSLSICHKITCPNKHCWNPEHLYAGTEKDNSRDSLLAGTHHLANRTHCKKGHRLDSYFKDRDRDKVHRYCRQCREDRVRAWRERVKAKAEKELAHVLPEKLD